MYAVIETGGKQYRVEVGTELEVELLDAEPGNTITLERVLLVADGDDASIGQPVVANAAVSAEVLRQARGEKTISFKYRPKARSRIKKGHRQELTVLRISDITLDGKSAAKAAEKAEADARAERSRLEEAAAKQAAADAALAAKLKAQSATADQEPAGQTEPTPPKKGRGKATAEAPVEATADAPEAPVEASADASDDTTAEGTPEAPSDASADTADEPTPKRSRATADAADPAAEDKPKRNRATKKDE